MLEAAGRLVSRLVGIRSEDTPVLVCWRHDYLPALAREVLQRNAPPILWPEERFDMTWVIRDDGTGGTFVQTPQLLVSGDQARVTS